MTGLVSKRITRLYADDGTVLGSPDGQAIAAAHGAYLNIKPIARPLPIEFAAMGSVGILLEADGMCWLRSMFGLSP